MNSLKLEYLTRHYINFLIFEIILFPSKDEYLKTTD